MAYQYQTFPIKDFGAGVDQQSAETQLKEGYSELIINGDPEPMGYVAKRKGYQRHAGQLPVRVTKVEQSTDSTNDLCLFLDSNINISSINLLKTRRTPLSVYGRTSESNTNTSIDDSDFLSKFNNTNYYPTFDSDVEVQFLSGPNSLIQVALSNPDIFVHTTKRTSAVTTDNEVFIPHENSIDIATGAVTIDYNNSGAAFEGYTYFSEKSPLSGTTYKSGTTVVSVGANTIPILVGTHGLSNFNIDSRVYRTDGTTYTELTPDEVTITASGDVSIDITNAEASSFDVIIYLTAYPALNVITKSVLSGVPDSKPFNLINNDFVGVVCYLEDEVTFEKQEIIPDSIIVDSIAQTCTVAFTNNTPDAKNFICYWEEIEITSNKLCLTSNASGTATPYIDSEPQLVIYGLDHGSIYGSGSSSPRPGWVTHVDSYRSEGENRLVAGIGGVLYTESNDRTTYGMPLLYPNLLGRVNGTTGVGPAIIDDAASSIRSRGYISAPDVDSNNRVKLTSVTYVSGNLVDYVFEITSFTPTVAAPLFSDIISGASGLEDYVSVAGTGYPINSGTFRVVSSSDAGSTITIRVANESLSCPDFNEANSSGRIGCFTNRVELTNTSRFLEGDLVNSDIFSFEDAYIVRRTSSTTLVIDSFTSDITIAGGLRLVGQRTGRVIPMRSLSGTPSVANAVVGDSLTRSGLDRQLTIQYINPESDELVDISGDGSTATLTLPITLPTTQFTIGQSILLREAGDYSGEQVITGIPSTTELEFASAGTTSLVGVTLVGKTIEVDESLSYEDAIDDSIIYQSQLRWVPIEAPIAQQPITGDFTYANTKHSYTSYLDADEYAAQSYLRSVMVSNNLYTTNGRDEVMKYDGINYYRAGLPRWQPQLFITSTDSPTSGGLIDYSPPTATLNMVDGNKAEVDKGDESQFSPGDTVEDNLGNRYTITEEYESESGGSTIGIIKVDGTIDAAATELSGVDFVRYYFRLNAVDINGNIITSAITGSEDTIVEIAAPTQVRLRLVGFPAWHIYDYARLEVEIYRTRVGAQAPYFKLDTIPMSFNQYDGYIDYVDSTDDIQLRDDDIASVALVGELDLITQASEPMRAKYTTSSGNRLILANLTDYPELSIKYESTTGDPIDVATLISGTSKYIFRRDNTNESTTSNLESVQAYQFVDTSSAIESTLNNDDDTATITSIAHGLDDGQWVYQFHSGNLNTGTFQDTDINIGSDEISLTGHGFVQDEPILISTAGTMPTGLIADTIYYIIFVDANTFSLATTAGGGAIDITVVGTGPFNISRTDERSLQYAGWFQVFNSTANTFDINHVHSTDYDASPIDVDRFARVVDTSKDIPVYLGDDANYDQRFLNPDVEDDYSEVATIRLSNAINASMRLASNPWMIASSGGEFGNGQLVVRQPKVESSFLEVTLPSFMQSQYNIFVTDLRRDSEESISAFINRYPSRLIVSGDQYPEVFLNPRATSSRPTNAVIDVNSADGQEITGVIPFFGDSAFGSAQKGGVLVVFKTDSIYLVDLSAKFRGDNPVQRLETQGLGCTAPYSIAPTRDGINFANRSGIYKLNRQLKLDYVGRKIERLWESDVNLDALDESVGHHYSIGRQYKLSYPTNNATENSRIFTYNHTREYDTINRSTGIGAWSQYTNHPATGWTNLLSDAYFSTTAGAVMQLRNLGDISDYRDDADAIQFSITLRALDFGDAGIRKVVSKVTPNFRGGASMLGTKLFSAIDMESTFEQLDAFRLSGAGQKSSLIQFSVNRRKGNYFQLRITNDAIDETVELTSVDIRVAGLSDRAITQAAQTTK